MGKRRAAARSSSAVSAAIALAALLLVAGVAGIAQAQDPASLQDPGSECQEATSGALPAGCDTEFTPVAKERGDVWTAIAGARFGENGERISDQTPYAVDFFSVRFDETGLGFAGGAACAEPIEFEALEALEAEGADCERVPVIYRFLDPDGPAGELVPVWEETYRGTSRGYVGSIAFTAPGEAIAVGGTGNYPRRELGRCEVGKTTVTDPDYCHGDEPPTGESDEHYAARDLAGEEPNAAGRARVWTYEDDRWREPTEPTELPGTPQGDPMRGFTAVDCSPNEKDAGRCLAGAYRQLWVWQGGEFTKAFSDKSTPPEVDFPAHLRFRVRAIRYSPDSTAVAVTAGCCAQNKALNQPWTMTFDAVAGSVKTNDEDYVDLTANPLPEESRVDKKRLTESLYSICLACSPYIRSYVASAGGPPPRSPAEGVPSPPEPQSRIIGGALGGAGDPGTAPGSELLSPELATIRLVAGDGDFGSPTVRYTTPASPPPAGADYLIDWAVGELTSTGQGLAYTTLETNAPLLDTLACPPEAATTNAFNTTFAQGVSDCELKESGDVVTGTKGKRLVGLPTYALNAFSYIPGLDTAWAAGDKGALLRLGGTGGAAAGLDEPEPPSLGARRPADLGERSLYEGTAPVPGGPPGPVPSLAAQPERELGGPRLIPNGVGDATRLGADRGSPREDVEHMVMSRDGGEGWALGYLTLGNSPTTLFHYDGSRWTRCETDSVPGVIEPDPACASLSVLRDTPEGTPVSIAAAARVPLERDADPTNDDEFEVLALTEPYALPGVSGNHSIVLRYRDGRWAIDRDATRTATLFVGSRIPGQLVFASPDDGWVTTGFANSRGNILVRFDGESWTDCHPATAAPPAACGDQSELLRSLPGNTFGYTGNALAEADGRVYFVGYRSSANGTRYPMILYKDREGQWSHDAEGGGYDPGCAPDPDGKGCVDSGDANAQGEAKAISIAPDPGGGYTGWASGSFGGAPGLGTAANFLGTGNVDAGRKLVDAGSRLMRLQPDGGDRAGWQPWDVSRDSSDRPLGDQGDAASDYLRTEGLVPKILTAPGGVGGDEGWMLSGAGNGQIPLLAFRDGRWQLARAPFTVRGPVESAADPQAMAPDGRGGFWLALRQSGTSIGKYHEQTAFYHYTDRAPEPVFEEAPHPVREEITAAAGGPDGSFWVATSSSAVYRYDRIGGWERVSVPGWDRGRTITLPSEATAIAIGPGGEGLVVGEGGRIAELSPSGVRLDDAAGALACAAGVSAPCGTGRNLRAAAIAPQDGSALVGGDARALLWRSGEGEFHSIPPPPTTTNATITGIAYPQPDQAFLTTDLGQVWAGDPTSGDWHIENRDPKSKRLVSVDGSGSPLELRAIAIDPGGHGYGVGEQGVVIERAPGGSWTRVPGFRDDFRSVALPANGEGEGALLGGSNGAIYTLHNGEFEVARPADPWDPLTAAPVTGWADGTETAHIVGLALLPGGESGMAEAWAASDAPSGHGRDVPGSILHYSSDPQDPLLDGASRVAALPDAPPERKGEVLLGAFGRSECQELAVECPEPQGSNSAADSIARRVGDEIVERAHATGERTIAVFTGDAGLGAGRESAPDAPGNVDVVHRRWVEGTASRFLDAVPAVPLFGALGGNDLARVRACVTGLTDTACSLTQGVQAGSSVAWRDAMSDMPAPWGTGAAPQEGGVSYLPVEVPGLGEPPLTGGARTHYALDLVDGGEERLRMVFADNSMGSLQASEPNQGSFETGGQSQWLEQVLCREGTGEGCTRGRGEPAVVVANTPTYSYGPGTLEHTATDAATFERTLLQHGVSALITGRLGWNGLYYTCPGLLHTPGPGGAYPSRPPETVADCTEQQGASEVPLEPPDPNELLGDLAPDTGILPGVVAGSAGGRFGPEREGTGSAAEGFWHGYSVIRIPADGEQSDVIVEQRPVFDWVSIRPAGANVTRMVRPSKKLALEGFGREVAGTDVPLRYDEITTDAITHRYDLLAADPAKPWLPKEDGGSSDDATEPRSAASERLGEEDPCGPYLCLDPKVGTIDPTSGVAKGGKGNYPRTYALALLSVGAHSATYPLVFEPRAAFSPPTPPPARPAALPPPPLPPTQPPQPPPPTVEALVPPVLPMLTAAQPPAPPMPPTPPPAESQAPLDLNLAPTALDVTPPTAVSQPPTPPVNPAPPSGARREARQRQAAAQKSGADSAEEGSDVQDSGGDLAQSPPTDANAASRHDFTALSAREQPSAWARDALIGGGLGIAALILALGLRTARPTPRRREPELPAPAWSRGRRR